MAAPPTESDTTIDALPAEILADVLLRVPTPAALVHAAAVSRSWRDAVATTDFLARYRRRHTSSPFVGLYVPRQFAGPPSFSMPDSIRVAKGDARDLKDAARRAFDFGEIRTFEDHCTHDAVDDAFTLENLQVHPDCRLLDCHNSRLLLTRGDKALEVRSPLARHTILLPFPPDVLDPNSLEASLLKGHDESAASFQVVCLQHRRQSRKRQVRAVDYDSSRKSWQHHPWKSLEGNIEGKPMRAGHRIICRYTGQTPLALLLDTSNMQFSMLPLPSNINFAIGEIEDNSCYFVESVGCTNHRLRVWQLEENLSWELKKDIKMDQVLGEHVGYYRPCAISNGIALLCSTTRHHHFVVDLNTCRMKDKFEFHGSFAYPMQMPWPPAFSSSTSNVIGSHHPERRKSMIRLEQGARCHPKYCIKDPKIPDDIQIATSCCRDASEASTSCESVEQRGEVARDCAGGELDGDGLLFCDGRNMNEPQDLDIQEPTATARTPATEEQCYVPNDHLIPDMCDLFSELMNSEGAGGFDLHGGPAFVGNPRTRSGESDTIEGLFCGTLATAPAAASAVESEEPLLCVCRSQSLNHDLLLQPPTLASCPEQGRKWDGSRESKRSLEAVGPGRRTWNPKPKFLEPIFALMRRRSFSIASKISDEVQTATSSCSGGSSSTIKFTDSGKQPIIDDNITGAPSLPDSSSGESAEQMGEVAQDCAGGKLGRDVCAPVPSNELQDLDMQCRQFSDLVHSEVAGGFDLDGGPASMGDPRTGSGESDMIEGLFCGTLATAPAAASAVESEEPLSRVCRSQSLNHDLLLQPSTLESSPEKASPNVEPLLLQPLTLASCPQQGGKLDVSRGGKVSPEATMGRGRRQKKPNAKYFRGDWLFDDKVTSNFS